MDAGDRSGRWPALLGAVSFDDGLVLWRARRGGDAVEEELLQHRDGRGAVRDGLLQRAVTAAIETRIARLAERRSPQRQPLPAGRGRGGRGNA